jgi:hypothetical protein
VTVVERRVRAAVFRHFADHGVAPSSADLARVVSVSASDVRSALGALATAHLLVLEESGRIMPASRTCVRASSSGTAWLRNSSSGPAARRCLGPWADAEAAL